jgi:hypothetical protein
MLLVAASASEWASLLQIRSPFREAHPFDGFDRLTAGRLRMTLRHLSRSEVKKNVGESGCVGVS